MAVILGIESSSAHASAALWDGTEVLASRHIGRGRAHDRFLVPAIEGMLADTGLTYDGLDGIAVGTGPGLFTGLRVGIATAQAIGYAAGKPVHGVCSLDALGHALRHASGRVCVCMDARRSEVYWALYTAGARDGKLSVGPAADLPQADLYAGDGPLFYDVAGPSLLSVPGAESVAALYESGGAALPVYLRKSDAEMNAREL